MRGLIFGSLAVGLLVVECAAFLTALFAAPAPKAPQTVTVDLGGDVKMEFVLIPKGKFLMGSPTEEKDRHNGEVQHEVEITRPFYLGIHPVTQEQYQAVIGKNPSWFCKGGNGADKVKDQNTKQFPVEWVSWNDAQAFCRKLREVDKRKRTFRLPTEAEWEYACRAGTTTPFYFGSELNGRQANCDGNHPYGTEVKGPFKSRTTEVGEYGVNKWGLCDMHGNVCQWCEDYFGPYEGLNPQDPLQIVGDDEDHRVVRGGCHGFTAVECRAAFRERAKPTMRTDVIGFRVALSLD